MSSSTPKPMLLRWRILIESATSSSGSPVSSSTCRSTSSTSSSACSLRPWMNSQRGPLGDVAPHQQDAQAEDGAQGKGDPPADVDGRVLPADAGPGEEPAGVEPERVHRERGQHRRHQVQDEGDDEQLLAAEPVGQVAEEQRPQAGPEDVDGGGQADLAAGRAAPG